MGDSLKPVTPSSDAVFGATNQLAGQVSFGMPLWEPAGELAGPDEAAAGVSSPVRGSGAFDEHPPAASPIAHANASPAPALKLEVPSLDAGLATIIAPSPFPASGCAAQRM
jgi:hypothetical protein